MPCWLKQELLWKNAATQINGPGELRREFRPAITVAEYIIANGSIDGGRLASPALLSALWRSGAMSGVAGCVVPSESWAGCERAAAGGEGRGQGQSAPRSGRIRASGPGRHGKPRKGEGASLNERGPRQSLGPRKGYRTALRKRRVRRRPPDRRTTSVRRRNRRDRRRRRSGAFPGPR